MPMALYNFQATTNTLSIGLSKAVNDYLSVTLSADFHSVRARGRTYPDNVISAGIHYSYY